MNNYFHHYVSMYFDYLINIRGYSKNTILTYRNAFIDLINMLKKKKVNINEMTITEFSSELIMKYIIYLKDERNNQAITINNKLAAIKSFVNFLKFKNLTTLEVCVQIENIKPLKVSKKIPDYYSIEEINYLIKSIDLESTKGLLYLSVIVLLYECALRVNELCSLKKKDIRNEGKTISIFIEESKNGTSRTIPMDTKSSSIIKKYLSENIMEEEDYLFHKKDKTPYTRDGINKMLGRIMTNAKKKCKNKEYFNKKIHSHMFRHSRSTHMLDAGIDLATIKEFLGHKSLNSTAIYLHLTKRKEQDIINKNMLKKEINLHRTQKEKNNLENYLRNLG